METKLLKISHALTAVVLSAILCVSASVYAFAADEEAVMTEPINKIPLLIIRVDESDDAISKASADDSDHKYGNIEQMTSSNDPRERDFCQRRNRRAEAAFGDLRDHRKGSRRS